MSWKQRPFPLILILYLLITSGYSLIVPLFETPDEHFHFFTINEIANSWQLPIIPAEYDPYLGPEPAQPPLYYLIAALIAAPFDTAVARDQVTLNPFAWIGSAEAVVNLNRTIFTEQERWPWQGYALAAHLIRLFSVMLGAGTVWLIYKSGRLIWPNEENVALLAAGVVAFLPQFNFIHSAVTNDTLITFLASLGVWQLLRLWHTVVSPRRLLLLGITIGLAALSKNAGILLLVYAVGFLFVAWLRGLDGERPFLPQFAKWVWETAVYIILPVLLLAGWLWLRNYQLYGDFTAANQFVAIAGGDRQYTIGQVLAENGGLWLSFFAVFGWFNLRPPEWIYWLWNIVMGLAGLGLLLGIWQAVKGMSVPKQRPFLTQIQTLLNQKWVIGLLLFGWLLAVYAGLITFMLQTEAAQGRLLFPAILPIALGVAYGLWKLDGKLLPILTLIAALCTTVYCLLFTIRPAYALPQTVETLPTDATPLNAPMGDGLTLLGSRIETDTAVENDLVWITLYWRRDEPLTEPPSFKFEILGQDLERPLGQIHTFHGRGLYPPTLWPTGEIIADRFPVRLDVVPDPPVLAGGFARLVPLETAVDAPIEEGVFVGGVKVEPQQWPMPVDTVLAQLGESIGLVSVMVLETAVAPGDTVEINITWQALLPPMRDFATLVHLGDPTAPPLAQGDAHPRDGSYPTRVWEVDEVIHDQYQLRIPDDIEPGCYPLLLGMYDPNSFERLQVLTAVDLRRGAIEQYVWTETAGISPNRVFEAAEICVEE